ncbi:MAG: hypothetical protein JRI85_10880 [Deltaproteobacteria bacterium]|nr:hypothetical protein [Deltaproteobacteria bacterium]
MEPISAILALGGKLLDRAIPDKTEAAKAKMEMARMAQDGELRELEVGLSAIIAEAKSSDPWTSRARPSFLYVMYVMILGAVPMGVLSAVSPETAKAVAGGVKAWLTAIPNDLWWLFGAGYLGYTGARSFIDKRQPRKLLDALTK